MNSLASLNRAYLPTIPGKPMAVRLAILSRKLSAASLPVGLKLGSCAMRSNICCPVMMLESTTLPPTSARILAAKPLPLPIILATVPPCMMAPTTLCLATSPKVLARILPTEGLYTLPFSSNWPVRYTSSIGFEMADCPPKVTAPWTAPLFNASPLLLPTRAFAARSAILRSIPFAQRSVASLPSALASILLVILPPAAPGSQ